MSCFSIVTYAPQQKKSLNLHISIAFRNKAANPWPMGFGTNVLRNRKGSWGIPLSLLQCPVSSCWYHVIYNEKLSGGSAHFVFVGFEDDIRIWFDDCKETLLWNSFMGRTSYQQHIDQTQLNMIKVANQWMMQIIRNTIIAKRSTVISKNTHVTTKMTNKHSAHLIYTSIVPFIHSIYIISITTFNAKLSPHHKLNYCHVTRRNKFHIIITFFHKNAFGNIANVSKILFRETIWAGVQYDISHVQPTEVWPIKGHFAFELLYVKSFGSQPICQGITLLHFLRMPCTHHWCYYKFRLSCKT